MNYQQKDWLGRWQNFESYLVSTAPAMQACWTQAEEAAKALPMFQAGVKTFWQRACGTALAGPVLGGWQISLCRQLQLCGTVNHTGAFAAQLQRHRGQVLRCLRHHLFANRHAAGKEDIIKPLV